MKRTIVLALAAAIFGTASAPKATAAQYEALLAQPEEELARTLQAIVNSTGHACPKVTFSQFNGSDRDATGYWAVACSDGGNWMVSIKNDAGGTSSVLSCEILKLMDVDCWEKF